MKMVPVKSSVIRKVGYDLQRKVVRIEFHTGTIYDYQGVPKETARLFFKANSIGTFYNHFIRDLFPFEQIHEAAA